MSRGLSKHVIPPEVRFWEKVNKYDLRGCWTWVAAKDGFGYGIFTVHGPKFDRAHRVSWIFTYGSIPKGMLVLHKCDNPACVKPDHLFLGTYKDNFHDMAQKGRVNHKQIKEKSPKLTWSQVREIRSKYIRGKEGCGFRVLGEEYGVSSMTIRSIVQNKTWRTEVLEQ